MRRLYFSKRAWAVPLALAAASLLLTAQAPAPTPITDKETELGDSVYKELKGEGKIIAKSPLYDAMNPVATTIIRVAQPQYEHPFKFYLIHDPRPNAGSVPGGAVYVTDQLLYFVRNTEELASVLCHETSHTIHHDSMNRVEQMEKAYGAAIGATILLGPTLANAIAASIITDMYKNAYSRQIETSADLKGSDTCAAAGYNPYGMIWLMQDFKEANPDELPQALSDHPSFESRIEALQKHFRENPAVFSGFNSDRKVAKPFSVSDDTPVVFLRP